MIRKSPRCTHCWGIQKHFLRSPSRACQIIHISYDTKHSVIMTPETGVRPPGVPAHGPPYFLHKRLTILELFRSLPINHKFSCFLWEESIHKHLRRSPSRTCSAMHHPIYFIKGLITGKLFRFPSLNLYNDVSNDKIHITQTMMSQGHWGGLGDFIISRLQLYISRSTWKCLKCQHLENWF